MSGAWIRHDRPDNRSVWNTFQRVPYGTQWPQGAGRRGGTKLPTIAGYTDREDLEAFIWSKTGVSSRPQNPHFGHAPETALADGSNVHTDRYLQVVYTSVNYSSFFSGVFKGGGGVRGVRSNPASVVFPLASLKIPTDLPFRGPWPSPPSRIPGAGGYTLPCSCTHCPSICPVRPIPRVSELYSH